MGQWLACPMKAQAPLTQVGEVDCKLLFFRAAVKLRGDMRVGESGWEGR